MPACAEIVSATIKITHIRPKEKRKPTQAELLSVAPRHPVYVQWMYGWAMLTPAAYNALNIRSITLIPAQIMGAIIG